MYGSCSEPLKLTRLFCTELKILNIQSEHKQQRDDNLRLADLHSCPPSMRTVNLLVAVIVLGLLNQKRPMHAINDPVDTCTYWVTLTELCALAGLRFSMILVTGSSMFPPFLVKRDRAVWPRQSTYYSLWLTLSLPGVISHIFFFQSLTRDISYSMENLAFDSLLKWKLIELSILMTSLICSWMVRRIRILSLGMKRLMKAFSFFCCIRIAQLASTVIIA